MEEDGWKTQIGFTPPDSSAPLPTRRRSLGTHLRCRCVPYQRRPSGPSGRFCPPRRSPPRGEAPAEGPPRLRQTQQRAAGSCGHSQRQRPPAQPVKRRVGPSLSDPGRCFPPGRLRLSLGLLPARRPHLPLASLVLSMEAPADSNNLSAAPLWPFILEAEPGSGKAEKKEKQKKKAKRQQIAGRILTEHSAGG